MSTTVGQCVVGILTYSVFVTYLISAFSTLLRGSVTGRICPVSTLSIIPFVLNFYFTLVLISSTTAEV